MHNLCPCTDPGFLTTIPDALNRCLPGKIAKVLIQKNLATNDFIGPGAGSITLEASWSGLPDASDSTKVSVTGYVEEVIFEETELLKDGENFDGAEIVVTSKPQPVSFIYRNLSGAQYDALRDMMCERDLAAYFIDDDNKFLCRLVSADRHNGFRISFNTFGLSDPSRAGGKQDQFKAKVMFELPAGWYSDHVKVTPESGFFPLTEIVPT